MHDTDCTKLDVLRFIILLIAHFMNVKAQDY
jgi:hypothetical protein